MVTTTSDDDDDVAVDWDDLLLTKSLLLKKFAASSNISCDIRDGVRVIVRGQMLYLTYMLGKDAGLIKARQLHLSIHNLPPDAHFPTCMIHA